MSLCDIAFIPDDKMAVNVKIGCEPCKLAAQTVVCCGCVQGHAVTLIYME